MGKIRGAFSRVHRALDGWMLARAPASPAQVFHGERGGQLDIINRDGKQNADETTRISRVQYLTSTETPVSTKAHFSRRRNAPSSFFRTDRLSRKR